MDTKKSCEASPRQKYVSSTFCNQFGCARNGALNEAFEKSPIGEAFVSEDGRFLTVNQSYADILGYSIPEIKNLNFMDITHPDDLALDIESARSVKDGLINSYEMEKRYIKKNKSTTWVHIYVSGIFDQQKNFQYYVVHAINIGAIKEKDSIISLAAESGGVGVWHWDINNNVLEWNKEMYSIFGVKEGESVKYENWENSLHPDDKERAIGELQKALKNGGKFESYYRIIADGKTKYIRTRSKRLSSTHEHIVIGTNIDVTDFKDMKAVIAKNNEELEYFTYSVSHDLKSPLVTLAGFSSLIKYQLNKKDKSKISFDIINEASDELQKATQHLSSTIDSILHLSRIGRIYMEKTLLSTGSIVDNVVNLNAMRIRNEDIKIVNENNINVFVQKEIFISIIQNLITNSLDHARVEGSPLEISLDFINLPNNKFEILFKDNGKGMTQKQIDNLFNYSNREFAKGFGMVIIKKGVEYHNGSLHIESEKGKGTEFRIIMTNEK